MVEYLSEHQSGRYIMKKFTKVILISILSMTGLFALTACNPVLSLKPDYTYTDLHFEVGQAVPSSVEDYIDLSQYTKEEQEFIIKNTTIECDGLDPQTHTISAMGDYTLVIKYCGNTYRTYKIDVSDTLPPTITYNGDLYTFRYLDLSEDQIKGMFTATDNSGVANLTIDSSSVNFKAVGEYIIKATATDASGNTATAEGKVIVQQPSRKSEGTYVYISISSQTLSFFENGTEVLTCPVVTGCVTAGNGTPKGVYRVTEKIRNATLRGDDYESFVSYWIGFIGSMYGMHDASWRSSFGGTIYYSNGSHGCVNMPYSSVAQLFSMVEVGTPVIVD